MQSGGERINAKSLDGMPGRVKGKESGKGTHSSVTSAGGREKKGALRDRLSALRGEQRVVPQIGDLTTTEEGERERGGGDFPMRGRGAPQQKIEANGALVPKKKGKRGAPEGKFSSGRLDVGALGMQSKEFCGRDRIGKNSKKIGGSGPRRKDCLRRFREKERRCPF